MTYRRQLRRARAAHADEQLVSLLNDRVSRRTLVGATLRRLDEDGAETGDVLHLNAEQARELLDREEV